MKVTMITSLLIAVILCQFLWQSVEAFRLSNNPNQVRRPLLTSFSLQARKSSKDTASTPSSSSSSAGVPSSSVNSNSNNSNTNTNKIIPNAAKLEALQGVLHSLERSYGKGTILKLGESPTMVVETSSSGSMTLDIALGGGYPKGRVVEIYGPESSGKTTLALHAAAEIQKNGGMAAFIDAEHALDPVYARNLGVNVDELFVCQPDSGEMALDVVDQLVRSSAFDLIVIDSVAALVPRAELEGDMQDMQMGLQARLMSKALRKITGSLSRSQTTVLFLNQLRSKIGVMFGNPEVTAGGNALKFYASVRLDIRRKEILKDNTGINVRVKVVKNKVAPPFKVIDMDIFFGSGIDSDGCLVDAAEMTGVFVRKGSWYYDAATDTNIAQGRRLVVEYLKQHPDIKKNLDLEVRKRLFAGALASSSTAHSDSDSGNSLLSIDNGKNRRDGESEDEGLSEEELAALARDEEQFL